MRTTFRLLLLGGTSVALACGCGSQFNNDNTSGAKPAIVYAKPGQSVKEAVDSLPSAGGAVVLAAGVWQSGYGTDVLTRPNITIQGSGRPAYNQAYTAMSGGTIIQGVLAASTGADHLTITNLGVDAGSDYINSKNGGVPTDALAIYNKGQVIGAPPVQALLVDDVSCLGYSPVAAAHCMLIENVTNAYVHDVVTVMNLHGLVLKGTNSTVDGVYARGHSIDAFLVKSDDYAPASHDSISNIMIQPLFTPGDTKGIIIAGIAAPVSDITISQATILSPLAWGVLVQGANSATSASGISFSGITVDYPSGSPAGEYCMQFVQYVSAVNIDDLSCSNMWSGMVPYLPVPGAFDNFTLAGSHFSNIATNAMETYGTWSVSNTSFDFIGQSGIVNPYGVTTVYMNEFSHIGDSDLYPAGGTFAAGGP